MNSPTGRLTWGSIPLELLGVTVLLVMELQGLYGQLRAGDQETLVGLRGLYGHPGIGGLSSVHCCGETRIGFQSSTPSRFRLFGVSPPVPDTESIGSLWEGDSDDTNNSIVWSTSTDWGFDLPAVGCPSSAPVTVGTPEGVSASSPPNAGCRKACSDLSAHYWLSLDFRL